MGLRVAPALVGTPEVFDEFVIMMDDGRRIVVNYEPHRSFNNHIWKPDPNPLHEARAELVKLAERGIPRDFLNCYIDPSHQIAVGEVIKLVVVPNGNMHDWPRFTTDCAVRSLGVS